MCVKERGANIEDADWVSMCRSSTRGAFLDNSTVSDGNVRGAILLVVSNSASGVVVALGRRLPFVVAVARMG